MSTLAATMMQSVTAGAAVSTELVTDFHCLVELASDWERLWKSDPKGEVFQSFAWARAWWRAFGHDLKLCTPVIRRQGEVIGILPLVRSGSTVQFLGDPGSDYNDVICSDENTVEVMASAVAMLMKLPGWITCRLGNLPDRSRIVRSLNHLPMSLRRRTGLVATSISSAIAFGENRGEIIRQARRKPTLKRHVNKLNKAGEVVFRHIESRVDAHRHLENLFQQHIERRAMAGDSSQFLKPESRLFYHALVDELDPRRELRFCVLELDDRPIAYHFGFKTNCKYLMYKMAFDIDYWEYSPGDVLLSNLLRHADEPCVCEFDFTIGREDYKEHFANHISEVYSLFIHRATVESYLRVLIGRSHCTAIRKLATSPFLQTVRARLDRARRFSFSGSSYQLPEIGCWRAQLGVSTQFPSGAAELSIETDHLAAAKLSDLARLALKFPLLLDCKRLQQYRLRLRKGDSCYLIPDTSPVQVAWIGKRDYVLVQGKPVPIEPAMVLYDLCSFPYDRRPTIHPALLTTLIRKAHTEGVAAYLCCVLDDKEGHKKISSIGFQPFGQQRY